MIVKKNFAVTFIVSSLVMGFYQITNDDFLEIRDVQKYPPFVNWIDDNIFGIIVLTLAVFLAHAFLRKKRRLQQTGIILLGAEYFSLGTVYFYRSLMGNLNITWILFYTLFSLLLFSIQYKGGRLIYEGYVHE